MTLITRLLPLLAGGALVCLSACLSPAQGFCQSAGECDDDTANLFLGGQDVVGSSEDSVAVCVAQQNSFLRQLRANEEETCRDVADAWEKYMACVGEQFADGDECDGLYGPFGDDNACQSELDDYTSAVGDADNDCSSSET